MNCKTCTEPLSKCLCNVPEPDWHDGKSALPQGDGDCREMDEVDGEIEVGRKQTIKRSV